MMTRFRAAKYGFIIVGGYVLSAKELYRASVQIVNLGDSENIIDVTYILMIKEEFR